MKTVSNVIKAILKGIFKILELFAAILMCAMVLIVFVQVILRYCFDYGLFWGEEVTNLCMLWFGFIGIAIDVIEKQHISIELFTNWLPPKALDILIRTGYILICAFGVVMIFKGVEIMQAMSYVTLPATKWSAAVPYFVYPVAGVLVVINAVLVVIKREDVILGEKNAELQSAAEDTQGNVN